MARYNIVSANNGEDALALIAKYDPVAVVLDVQMPRKTGLDVLGAIKGDPRTSTLPVMMLTGERNPDTVLQAMGGGADDYMIKPFDPDTLLDRVNRLVRARAADNGQAAVPGMVWEL
jgi:DNA-binding response OmpR family regulator